MKLNQSFICADFGLTVSYEDNKKAVVNMPDSYRDKMCGICGDFDGNKQNDFFPRGATEAGSYAEIGGSWYIQMDPDE